MLTLAGLPNFPKAGRCINGVGAFAEHVSELMCLYEKARLEGELAVLKTW